MERTLPLTRRIDTTAVAVGLITLAGFLLRALPIAATRLWTDEIFQAHAASVPLGDLLAAIAADAGAPPLDFFGTRLTMALVPDPVIGPRLWPLLMGTLAIPGAYLAGRAWFSPRAGMLAAIVVSVSPFLIYYSTEARYYAFGATLALFFLWALGERRWLWLGVTAALGIYTILSFAGLMAVAGVYLLWRREWRGVAALIVAGILFLPWFLYDLPGQIASHYEFTTPGPIESVTYAVVAMLGMRSPWIVAVIITAIVLGLAYAGLRRWPSAWPLAVVGGLVLVMMWYVCWRAGYFWVPRYVILTLPILLLLASAGAATLTPRRLPWVAAAYFVLILPSLIQAVTGTVGMK